MKSSVLAILAVLCLLSWGGAAGAADNPLLGSWTVNDPATGKQEELIVTPETLQFGAGEPQIPYRLEGSGETYSLFIGGPNNPPARIVFRGADSAELITPGNPPVAMTRSAAAPAATNQAPVTTAAGAAAPPGDLMDEITAALVPYGVSTRFEPLNQSLEHLLSAGWKLDQAAGAAGGFTLLLTNGSSHALCILVPKNLGQADTALSDCRRLN